MIRSSMALLSAITLLAAPAGAASILNGSFESGNDPGTFTAISGGNSTAITGWTVGGSSVDYIGTYWTAQDGNRSIDLAGSGDGSISQVIATIIGQSYDVSYWIARNPDGGVNPRTGFIDVGGAPAQLTFNGVGSTRSNMMWEQGVYNFTALSTNTMLRFSSDPATSNSFFGLALDNVSIAAAVPEPATWAFMIFGFGAIGGAMRRQRKANVKVSYA